MKESNTFRITNRVALWAMPLALIFALGASGLTAAPAHAEGIIVQGSVKSNGPMTLTCNTTLGGADALAAGGCSGREDGPTVRGGGNPPVGGAEAPGDDYGDDIPTGWDCEDIGGGIESCTPPGAGDGQAGELPVGGEPGPNDSEYVAYADDSAGCSGGGVPQSSGLLLAMFALGLLVLRRRAAVQSI